MAIIRDLDINGDSEVRHASAERKAEIGALNPYAGHIANAFLIALRANNFSAGKIQKIIIRLKTFFPKKPSGDLVKFQDMNDVYAVNVIFDFHEYVLKNPLDKAEMLQETLFEGLLEISNELQLSIDPVEAAMKSVEADEFLFEYKDKKPVVRKSAGLYAQAVLAESPIADPGTMIAAEVFEIEGNQIIGSCVFYEFIRLHQYTGKLNWISPSRLIYIPKNESLSPMEAEIVKNIDPFEKMRSSISLLKNKY